MKKTLFIITILCILLSFTVTVYAQTPDEQSSVSYIADKLIVDLGAEWAGAVFELETDMGKYPGTITVNESGKLITELGDSKVYTLTKLEGPAKDSAFADNEAVTGTDDTEDIISEKGSLFVDGENSAEKEQEGIPVLHLVLFFGGGLICIAALIIMRIMRVRRERRDQYEEDDF